MALLPQMTMAVIGSTLSGLVMARLGPRPVMLAGLLVGALGLGVLAAVVTGPYWAMVAPLVATGLGVSFTMPAATAAVMEAAPTDRAGIASGVISAARQAGGVVGVALLGTLAARHGHLVTGVHVAIALAAAAFCAAVVLTATCVARVATRRTTKERRG